MHYRILLIESIDDDISRNRAKWMANNPSFNNLLFEHYYPITPTEQDKKYISDHFIYRSGIEEYFAWLDRGAPLLFDNLIVEIEKKVHRFKPDFIILHCGCVFVKHPEIILKALSLIKDNYPHIKFGSDREITIKNPENERIFDHDDNVKKIEHLLFNRIG